MKDPERLLQSGASDVELALLRAGVCEEPPTEGKQRLTAALGAAAVLSTAKAASAGSALLGKGLLLVTAAVAVSAGVYFSQSKPAPSGETASAIQVSRAPEPTAPLAVPEPPPALEPARPEPPPAPIKRAAAPRGSATIAAEIAALDAARQTLSASPRATLAALARYDHDFPRGVLRQEARLLRIEALARSGERARAQKLAEQFLAESPGSPHASRVRALVGLAE